PAPVLGRCRRKKSKMINAILASTSTIHGHEYLEYILPEVKLLFKDCTEVIFIPYARPGGISHEDYTSNVSRTLEPIGLKVRGLHEFKDPVTAIIEAQGIFTGGGNTFLLVEKLYRNKIMTPLREALKTGKP